MQLQMNSHNKEDDTVGPYLGQRYGTGVIMEGGPLKNTEPKAYRYS